MKGVNAEGYMRKTESKQPYPDAWPTASAVRTVVCPRCKANPGHKCIDTRSRLTRSVNHAQRTAAYRESIRV
jgi:hypothetical protein